MKIVVDMHETPYENMERAMDIVKELYFEALRAPLN
jgi:hypothetical protein